jgi:hypothetical protein
MKKAIGAVLLLMAIQAPAFADSANAGDHIVCHEKGSGLFYIQLQVGEIVSDDGIFAPKVYAAEFTSLQGPRLVGTQYNIQVIKKGISTRLKSGYSYAAQIPDGSQLYIENTLDVSSSETGGKSFTAQLSNWHNSNLYFTCEVKN